jgi:hypothetical protein
VGTERPRRGQRPSTAPPFGGPGRSRAALGFRALPVLVKIALVALLVVLVAANLPLILIGLLVWLVLAHQGVCRGPRRTYQRR